MPGFYRRISHVLLRTRTLFVCSLLTGLLACEAGSLFLPDASPDESVTIRMAESGATLGTSGSLEVSLEFPSVEGGGEFDTVSISVEPASEIASLSTSGLSQRRERSIERDDLGADLVFTESLEGLLPGLYTVHVRVLRGAEVVGSVRRTIFVVDGEFAIDGLSVYPAVMIPGASGILQASLRMPEESDPYLRWWLNGELLTSGYAADGYDEIEWAAPEHDAAVRYTMELELFPGRPPSDADGAVRSSIRETTDVLVSSSRALRESGLGALDSFFMLYRLQGTFVDDGVRSTLGEADSIASAFGAPRLNVLDGLFGYELDGTSGFESAAAAVPFLGSTPSPFTFHSRVIPFLSDIEREGALFETHATDYDFTFGIDLRTDGTPAVRVQRGSEFARAYGPPGLLVDREPALLSVSVVPAENRTSILWFLNGRLVDISDLEVSFPASPISSEQAAGNAHIEIPDAELQVPHGHTRIGAVERGFSGLVDEVGILFRSESGRIGTDEAIFRNAMESRYAGRLAYARGFQGMFVPGELEIVGRVTVRRGALELTPGSSVLFPAFLFQHEQLVVELTLGSGAEDAEGLFRFAVEGGGPSIDVSSSGVVWLDGEQIGVIELVDSPPVIVVRLAHQDGVLRVRGPNDFETRVALDTSRFEGVRLSAMQGEAQLVPLRIRSVVAHRDRVSLADRIPSAGSPAGE